MSELRAVTVQTVMDIMNALAPPELALANDKIGLQIGEPSASVERVWVALEATPAIVEEAVKAGVDMLVTHHAILFRSLSYIHTNQPRHRAIAQLLANDIAVFNAHTNLDVAWGGVNDVIAQRIGLQSVEILDVTYKTPLFKLVVYVPQTHVELVRDAICNAGAGAIGNYTHCTFAGDGTGTFLPQQGANPYIGKIGALEYVAESRLETVVPEPRLAHVLSEMQRVHPYEEVAYDVIRLEQTGAEYGIGRIGTLAAPCSLTEFADHVRQQFHLPHIRFAGPATNPIRRVAILGGSGAGWAEAARRKGADVLVTADVGHHDAADAVQDGIAIVDVTHAALEEPVCDVIVQRLRAELGPHVDVAKAPGTTDPFLWL